MRVNATDDHDFQVKFPQAQRSARPTSTDASRTADGVVEPADPEGHGALGLLLAWRPTSLAAHRTHPLTVVATLVACG